MNGGTKSRVSTISLGRLQCVRRDSLGPTVRKRRIKRRRIGKAVPGQTLRTSES
jgi:hypothetical protein